MKGGRGVEHATWLGCALGLLGSALAGVAAPEAAWSAAPAEPPARPARIVSLTTPADEVALALVEPERFVAIDAFADDPEASNVVREAGAVRGRMHQPISAEAVLAARPDLVLLSGWSEPQLESLLALSGVPVQRVGSAGSLAEVRAQIAGLGRVLGEPEGARALIDAMDARLDAVRARGEARAERPRVLLFAWSGYTPARGTLFCELVELAGARCAAAEAGLAGFAPLSLERLLEIDPDLVVVNGYRADGRARAVVPDPALDADPRMRTLRAVRAGDVVSIPSAHLLATSHHVASLAEDLSSALDAREHAR